MIYLSKICHLKEVTNEYFKLIGITRENVFYYKLKGKEEKSVSSKKGDCKEEKMEMGERTKEICKKRKEKRNKWYYNKI